MNSDGCELRKMGTGYFSRVIQTHPMGRLQGPVRPQEK